MIDVYVFINDKTRLDAYVQKLSFLMMINELDMQVTYSDSNFERFLEYTKTHRIYDGVFLIDADCDELASLDLLIDLRDDIGLSMMVLMSSRVEVALESVQKHLYITDLILKTGNQAEEVQRVEEVLKFCHCNLMKSNETNGYPSMFEVKSRAQKIMIPMREIYYIETAHTPHKLLLHSQHDTIEFYGKLSEITGHYGDELLRVHRSYVVNPDNISRVDYEQRCLYFEDGSTCFFTISRQALNRALKR